MIHLALHFLLPLLVALAFYRPRWRSAALLLIATMLVDIDHLLAQPIYDAQRCSIGFHPLHTAPAIAVYAACFVLRPWLGRTLHLIGLGLLIHMALDAMDCVV